MELVGPGTTTQRRLKPSVTSIVNTKQKKTYKKTALHPPVEVLRLLQNAHSGLVVWYKFTKLAARKDT
jgi:hypothetical protein